MCHYDNARLHTAALTAGTVEELHPHILPHPVHSPDVVSGDFHLFGALKEARGVVTFTADDEITLSM
jgi:hypothetical protein